MKKILSLAALCLAVTACNSQSETTAPAQEQAPAASTAPTKETDQNLIPMKTLMGHVIQHSAEEIWKWQGFVSDSKGERDLFPKTHHQWEKSENAALTLAEISVGLLHPDRKVDDPRWVQAVQMMRSTSMELAEASEKKDAEALLEIGGKLDDSCKACHQAFAPWAERPLAHNFQP